MEKKRAVTYVMLGSLFCIGIILALLPRLAQTTYVSTGGQNLAGAVAPILPADEVIHLPTPEPMKAIYMSACVAATDSWRENLKNFVDSTELNAVMIDIKDYSGTISIKDFPIEEVGSGCRVGDMKEFIAELHKKNIYVIGRITVFQDPLYAKLHPELAVKSKATGGTWYDRKGLAFIDVGARPYWDHIANLAKFSYNIGFDEINFDYVRYPSDGNMSDTYFSWTPKRSLSGDLTGQATGTPMTKAEVLESFFAYLQSEIEGTGMKTSADLFGMVTSTYDDMGIGQVLERALPYFDYIYPMVYPSHYPPNWEGLSNPAEHPYEVIKRSMTRGIERENIQRISRGLSTTTPSKLRPWIQDFDLGADYGQDKVRAQFQATYDIGLTSWLVWDASNRYTREAFLVE